jgi:hypothetical protein
VPPFERCTVFAGGQSKVFGVPFIHPFGIIAFKKYPANARYFIHIKACCTIKKGNKNGRKGCVLCRWPIQQKMRQLFNRPKA